jgi:transglutaminase-like putative cysteine protease/predicted Zn-dependent protease
MIKTLTAAFFGIFFFLVSNATDYEDAWTAINKKNFQQAKQLLQKATQDPATALDAYLTLTLLQTYQGKEDNIQGMLDKISENPGKNAYIYSLWFNGSVLGQYSKKQPYQLNLINRIISDNSFNGSIQTAVHYVKAMHHVFSNDYTKARLEWASMGTIQDWQLTGPFENLSGSGFNTTYGPATSPNAAAKFTGINNIEISWFTPAKLNREGWIFTYAHLPEKSAIIYAQTFVNAPDDMKVLLNAGSNGSLKIWVNDGLVLSEAKERVTELDYYKNYCTLKKGYNRVLIQLGYTNNSIPNFILRFTDEQLNPVKNLSSTSKVQAYSKGTDALNTGSLKHFAEDFFEKKVDFEPGNLINYVLLSQVYLRNQRTTEARQIIEKGLKLSPNNPLLKFELIQCLIKAENRTLLLQEIEWLKENDPDSYINYQMKVTNLIDEEKFAEADEELTKMAALYGEDENTMAKKATILGRLEKVNELVQLIERGFNKYPESVAFLSMKYNVKKLVDKDAKGALAVYEKFLKSNFNYNVISGLADEYKDQGMNDKYLEVLKELYNQSAYDPRFATALSKYFFEQRSYAKALEYAQEALQLAPYTGTYWQNVAAIQEEMNNKTAAIAGYKKAIYYDRTNYDARKKLNTLEQKTDPYKLLPETDVYALIKKAQPVEDHDYSYLLDEKGTVIYDEGASEEYITYVVKIHTQKGIDAWKELYLSYSSNTQTLLVEKSEVVKANGSKVPAERDEDHIVFTGLEAGDAIYVKYRVQNYTTGRIGKEFWDKFIFNSFAPSATGRYTLILPQNYKFTSQVVNSRLEPLVKDAGNFKIYTWELKNISPVKTEPLMPPLNDVGTVLHISTLKSWAEVANWYSDISYQNMTDNFELTALYNEIFANTKSLTNLEKAKLIYNYIVTNIRYSSVSFRQSGWIPQDVSKIISTRLGDCKDLSTLFVALAGKAGIPAQLVLIDTRDNGGKDMVLPSMDFNHCITLAQIDGKEYYIELTDSNLPFGSLPNNLYEALALIIPAHGQKSSAEIRPLIALNRTVEKIIRNITVTINGKDEKLNVVAKRYGSLTSGWRESYATLSAEKQKEEYEQSISNGYKNPVKLESLVFTGLSDLSDSLITNYSYTVKNEIIEAGSMKMIKVPFIDLVATLESLSSDKREFPIEYWNYENTDAYETTVTLQLPSGQKFLEVPENQNFSFKGSVYSVKYIKEGEKLKVHRTVKLQRQNISPADYEQFKKFFNDIVEAEAKYIPFK